MMALVAPVTCPVCDATVAVTRSANPTRTETMALLVCTRGHLWQYIGRLVPVLADPVGAARRRESRARAAV